MIQTIKLTGTGWDEKLAGRSVLAAWIDPMESWVFYSSSAPGFGTLQYFATPDTDSPWAAELVPDTDTPTIDRKDD